MNRRTFLLAAPWTLAGCSRGTKPPPATSATALAQRDARLAHLQALAAAKVPSAYRRDTPKPPHDLLKVAPELKGLTRLTMRLHPRFGDEPRPDESKLGGQFLWPEGEPWPTAPGGEVLFPILQLRAEDAPPQLAYKPGSDLLQLFWNPRFADKVPRTELNPQTVWRKSANVAELAAHPLAGLARGEGDPGAVWTDYVPVPCRFAPERVAEYPAWDVLPRVMRERVAAWHPDGESLYRTTLSVAPGTKVGGYVPKLPDAKPPACPSCRWGMDYLLTVAEHEWTEATQARWRPVEDVETGDIQAHAAGLTLGPSGGTSVFVCRRCEDWPTSATV